MPKHPYYPLNLSIPNFLPQMITMEKILYYFFTSLVIAIVLFLFAYSKRSQKKVNDFTAPTFVALWFFMCGIIHTIVEGYFVYTNTTIAGDNTFLANLWKEYAKSDSRYMVSDPTVLIIEGITAVSIFFFIIYTYIYIYIYMSKGGISCLGRLGTSLFLYCVYWL